VRGTEVVRTPRLVTTSPGRSTWGLNNATPSSGTRDPGTASSMRVGGAGMTRQPRRAAMRGERTTPGGQQGGDEEGVVGEQFRRL
jgi:hypothetical protein